MTSIRWAYLVASLICLVPVRAAEKHPITPQDLWLVKRVGGPKLSPDGKQAVFTVQEWSIEKNKSTTNLWLVAIADGTLRRLTTATAGDTAPTWSPDGSRIAFISRRGDDEVASLYVMPVDGGEPERILELPYGVATPRWMPDGTAIVVATTVIPELVGAWSKSDLAAMKAEARRRRESKMTAHVTENRQYRFFDHYLPDDVANRLLKVDVATHKFVDLTPQSARTFRPNGEIEYRIAPDGKHLALVMNSTPPPFRDFLNDDIFLLPTDGSGTSENLTAENRGDDGSPVFSPDGRSLVFARLETPYYSGEFRHLWRHDFATGKNQPLTAGTDLSFDDIVFSPDGRTLWLTAENKGVVPVFQMNAAGGEPKSMFGDGTSGELDVGANTAVWLNDTTSRPGEIFVLDRATGAVRQLTHVNDELVARLDVGRVESYWFTGAHDEQIQGWLVYPPGYDPKKTYPLVQLMHGGPHTMCRDSWSYRWNTHVFAAPGYVVTWVNRHGSTGFGQKFSQSILNQWGDMPFEDIMRSTDFLLKKLPNLDAKHLAAAGGSYGGYMAAWVLGHTDRFQCLIDHAGVNDSYAQYATDVPHGFPEVMGGKPWDNLEGMQRENPMFYAKNFKTPTLIIHNELDYRVPYGNGLELYGVLQTMGVPTRLVVFPNENHWVLSPQNAIYWHWEMQNWLSRYIGGKPSIEKPVFDGEAKAPSS
ncbi:MAG TPA: S9 family peptidase [Candidatus Didemnitutus sp.]|nr:S9 family peptidase [Candidatus Didemnitutus sp.]